MHAFANNVEKKTTNLNWFGIPIITEDQFCSSLPEPFSDCNFGIFKHSEADHTKPSSYLTINTGQIDRSRWNLVEALNGKDSLPEEWWKRIGPTPSANALGETG